MMTKKRIVLFTLIAMNIIDQPAPEVKIDQGVLSGKISPDGTFFEYLGIPYATTNRENRFQAPLPPPSWDGIYKAVDEHHQCPQPLPFFVIGTEDCLKVNVYVPINGQGRLPVMVYIHGGAFILGSGGKLIYGPDFLVVKDVIVVTFNYRLGILGFTCLGIKEAPGNAGLRDQIEALKWIKKNIAAFGGDPDNVTIFGTSAGAVSVSLLLASSAANNLFHKAIAHSGVSLSAITTSHVDPLDKAVHLVKKIGYNTKKPIEIYNIFKDMPYSELVGATYEKYLSQRIITGTLLLPCIEKNHPGIEPILDNLPYNLIKKNPKNIPTIYGSTDKEGLFIIAEETDETLEAANIRNLYDPDLLFRSENEAKAVDRKLREFYFNSESVSQHTIFNLSDLYTHLYFEMPAILETEMRVNVTQAPIYNYYFKYDGGRNFLKELFGFNTPGACHGDDIFYTFKSVLFKRRITEKDKKVIDYLTSMWTNFAKFGNPTPEITTRLPIKWKPTNKEEFNFLYIDEEFTMGSLPNPEAFKMWKDIYDKYRKKKIDEK